MLALDINLFPFLPKPQVDTAVRPLIRILEDKVPLPTCCFWDLTIFYLCSDVVPYSPDVPDSIRTAYGIAFSGKPNPMADSTHTAEELLDMTDSLRAA